MRLTKIAAPAVILTALTFAGTPAFAQSRHEGRSGGGGRSESHSAGAPRGGDRGGDHRGGGDRGGDRGGAVSRGYAVPRGDGGARYDSRRYDGPRYNSSYRNDGRYYDRRNVYVAPRTNVYVAPRVVTPYRGGYYDRSYDRGYGYGYGRGYAVPRHYTYSYVPRYGYSFAHPYWGPRYVRSYVYRPYAFRPFSSIGFGLFVGYSVPYTWAYPAYAPAWSYGYPGAYNVVPGPTTYGGLSFDVTPNDATVYVDGNYVGPTAQFDGSQQPLSLVAGSHRIELRAQGCEPLVFNVDVQPGQVIPYRGDLVPIGQYDAPSQP